MSATKTMDSLRGNAREIERQAERHRREMVHDKNLEVDRVNSARGEHRRRVDAAETHKQRLLSEMRGVRDMMQDRRLNARAVSAHNSGVTDRSLARAGKLACDSALEAQRWLTSADSVAKVASNAANAEKASLAVTQEANRRRIHQAQSNDVSRVDLANNLVSEAANACNEYSQRRGEQRDTQERFAERLQQQNSNRADSVRHHAALQVKAAIDKSSKDQMSAVHAIQKSREDAVTSVEHARAVFARKRAETMAQIENERVCANQATKMGNTLRTQAHEYNEEEQAKLQRMMRFVDGQASQKIANFDDELEEAKERNEIWLDHETRSREKARNRSEREEIEAKNRVNAAKLKLAELQAQCASYIRDLMDQHEEAKLVDSTKVQVAQDVTSELARYCSKTLAECEDYCAALIAKTESHADRAKARLEERVNNIDDLSKRRIQMMREQAQDRRDKAERQLHQLQEHVAYVQLQCEERKREEVNTAIQKTEIARGRHSAEVGRSEQRLAEMTSKRDTARAEFEFVISRLRGSLGEVRRYGLSHIVDILDPPLAEEPSTENAPDDLTDKMPIPTEEPPIAAEEPPAEAGGEMSATTAAAARVEATDNFTKPASASCLMATGSTMLPEDMGATAQSGAAQSEVAGVTIDNALAGGAIHEIAQGAVTMDGA